VRHPRLYPREGWTCLLANAASVLLDYAFWNALVSTATLLVVATAALAALRQLRHLRDQTSMMGLLRVLDDWRDPTFQRSVAFVRLELEERMKDPEFVAELEERRVDRARHPELDIADWYEQVGAMLKYGLIHEDLSLDVSSGSAPGMWRALEPTITLMRRSRGDSLYENFEYWAVKGTLFARRHPNGRYPRNLPRMRDLAPASASTDEETPRRG
jgi:hypothetical protein